MNTEINPVVQLRGVSKVYRTQAREQRRVVDELNLTLEAGEVLGLLGVNGAGKTTTIKMICGLIEPTAGSISINGLDVRRSRLRAMSQIGAVLEGTRNIYWPLSAWENLRYFARLKGCRGRAWQARAEQLLTELELWDRRDDPVAKFSRGMQQKVAIACALIADPPVLLLDEPTLGLDAQAAQTTRTWVDRLAREEGKTVLLTSHQLDLVEGLCDRVAVIHQGRLLVDNPIKELLALFRGDTYELHFTGHLDGAAQLWNGFEAAVQGEEITLTGEVAGQDELYALLVRARGCALTLVSVNRVEPTLEEVFLRLVHEDGELS
ncbi:MAG: transporter ATP-binding protein [Actinomycetia bacterium]|nr:transporter ATP-binding protein [Actinomycetes bacterium]